MGKSKIEDTRGTASSPAPDPNRLTLETYNALADDYARHAAPPVPHSVTVLLDGAVRGLATTARSLAIGSATGRDPLPSYVRICRVLHGRRSGVRPAPSGRGTPGPPPDHLRSASGPYDRVLANTVLLHFQRSRALLVMHKVHAARGVHFALFLQEASGEAWRTSLNGAPRYVCFWRADELGTALSEAGFDVAFRAREQVGPSTVWLHAVALKR